MRLHPSKMYSYLNKKKKMDLKHPKVIYKMAIPLSKLSIDISLTTHVTRLVINKMTCTDTSNGEVYKTCRNTLVSHASLDLWIIIGNIAEENPRIKCSTYKLRDDSADRLLQIVHKCNYSTSMSHVLIFFEYFIVICISIDIGIDRDN